MGHGDEIVLADVNFPTSSICRCGPEEIRADGLGIPQLLEAMLKLLPLDTYVEKPAVVMELVPSDRERGLQTPVWRSYQSILLGAGCAPVWCRAQWRLLGPQRADPSLPTMSPQVGSIASLLPIGLGHLTWQVPGFGTRAHTCRYPHVGRPHRGPGKGTGGLEAWMGAVVMQHTAGGLEMGTSAA
nr:fucose mutarotase isoform X5 [Camelus dromedarius]